MLFSLVSQVFAQSPCGAGSEDGGIDLGNCLKLSDGTNVNDVYTSPAFLVNLIVKNMFALAGIILFIMILLAGYKFILKGKEGIEEAKKIMTTAVIGFILMFSAYWIVQIISLLTGIVIPGVTIGS